MINKFGSPEDPNYRLVSEVLINMAENSFPLVKARINRKPIDSFRAHLPQSITNLNLAQRVAHDNSRKLPSVPTISLSP